MIRIVFLLSNYMNLLNSNKIVYDAKILNNQTAQYRPQLYCSYFIEFSPKNIAEQREEPVQNANLPLGRIALWLSYLY